MFYLIKIETPIGITTRGTISFCARDKKFVDDFILDKIGSMLNDIAGKLKYQYEFIEDTKTLSITSSKHYLGMVEDLEEVSSYMKTKYDVLIDTPRIIADKICFWLNECKRKKCNITLDDTTCFTLHDYIAIENNEILKKDFKIQLTNDTIRMDTYNKILESYPTKQMIDIIKEWFMDKKQSLKDLEKGEKK